jgi:hypothetical protein
MSTLATAPGVLGAALTTYITAADVMKLLGCRQNKAYQTIRELNKVAKEDGQFAYGQGKASKYIFAEKFGIPMDVINSVIENNRGGE